MAPTVFVRKKTVRELNKKTTKDAYPLPLLDIPLLPFLLSLFVYFFLLHPYFLFNFCNCFLYLFLFLFCCPHKGQTMRLRIRSQAVNDRCSIIGRYFY